MPKEKKQAFYVQSEGLIWLKRVARIAAIIHRAGLRRDLRTRGYFHPLTSLGRKKAIPKTSENMLINRKQVMAGSL